MRTKTRFVLCPIAASEIAKEDKKIPSGTYPNHRVKLKVELFLVSRSMVLMWCLDSHYSHKPTGVFKPDMGNNFINQSDLADTFTQSSRDDHTNSRSLTSGEPDQW